jgi:hypothetical protein
VWTDERINDLANQVISLRDVPQEMAIMKTERLALLEDLRECRTGIDRLYELRSEERKERDTERKERENLRLRHERERREDRKWLVGTALATVSIVIAALAVFLG